MDRIILSSQDVETLLKWRDQNKHFIRRNAAPFKGIMLEFPDTRITIKTYNDAGKISFYLYIDGNKAGKITGQQLPGGLFQARKNTTKLKSDDVQSIITVYASLMALIVYHKPEKTEKRRAAKQETAKRKPARQKKPGITYIFSSSAAGPALRPRGSHASPSGIFTVRGHYRHYKDGRAVWIAPYTKGNGQQHDKTYKLK